MRQHLPYGIGLAVLLVLLAWLTSDGAHPDFGVVVYVGLLGAAYRAVVTTSRMSRGARDNAVLAVLAPGLLVLLGMLSGWSTTYLVFIITTITIYSVFALGLNLEFGHTGIINFGHVAFMGIGAYTMAILAPRLMPHADILQTAGPPALGIIAVAALAAFFVFSVLTSIAFGHVVAARRGRPAERLGTNLAVAAAGGLLAAIAVVLVIPYPLTPFWGTTMVVFGAAGVGLLLAGMAGMLLGLPSLRLRADYLAIVTIGAAEILRRVWRNERDITGGPVGLTQLPRPFSGAGDEWSWLSGLTSFLDVRDPERVLLLLMALAALVLVLMMLWILLHSPYGRVLKAIREDEDVATALGKNVFLYKLQALAVGSMIAALAGVLLAWHRLFISPDTFIPLITFYAWIIIVMGGVGSNKGTLLGAVLLFTFFEATRALDLDERVGLSGPQGSSLRIVIIGLLLVLLMLFKPEGILGRREEMVLGD